MIRTSNQKARQYVTQRIPFKGSNTFGEWDHGVYIVYSYGYHFPIFAWCGGWFINNSRYSRTTSKHQSQLFPLPTKGMVAQGDLSEIKSFIYQNQLKNEKRI